MAELSEHDKLAIDLMAKGATAELEWDRLEIQRFSNIREREDKFTIWIVGLSTGAVAGLSISVRLAVIPRWQAVIIFLFFGISIVSGVIYTWILKELQACSDFYHHGIQAGLIEVLSVSLPGIKLSEGISIVQTKLQQILEKTEPTIAELDKEAQIWRPYQHYFQFVAPSFFVFGVIALAVVASINWPITSPADKVPTQVPQLRQG